LIAIETSLRGTTPAVASAIAFGGGSIRKAENAAVSIVCTLIDVSHCCADWMVGGRS
jgi:hypothetical protein